MKRIAAALMVAARKVGEPAWEREAVALARSAALRLGETSITDAGLCHGTFGASHLFNRMYQATGEASLGDAARYGRNRGARGAAAGRHAGLFLGGADDHAAGTGDGGRVAAQGRPGARRAYRRAPPAFTR